MGGNEDDKIQDPDQQFILVRDQRSTSCATIFGPASFVLG